MDRIGIDVDKLHRGHEVIVAIPLRAEVRTRTGRVRAPQAPGTAARLGACAAAANGARPASSRDAAARIAPIASGSSIVAIDLAGKNGGQGRD